MGRGVYRTIQRIEAVKVREPADCSYTDKKIDSPEKISIIFSFLKEKIQETVLVVCLDTKNKILGYAEVARGSNNAAYVKIKDIALYPIITGATSIILLHNHPSGECEPSFNDIKLTNKVKDALEIFGIQLLDHIIIGDNYFSFKEKGLI